VLKDGKSLTPTISKQILLRFIALLTFFDPHCKLNAFKKLEWKSKWIDTARKHAERIYNKEHSPESSSKLTSTASTQSSTTVNIKCDSDEPEEITMPQFERAMFESIPHAAPVDHCSELVQYLEEPVVDFCVYNFLYRNTYKLQLYEFLVLAVYRRIFYSGGSAKLSSIHILPTW